jgi:mono/diheme cytochrome c family protein
MTARILTVALAMLLAAALAGCGGDESATTTETTPTATETNGAMTGGDVEAGREVFIATGCGSCHTLQAAGTTGMTGPNLDNDLPVSVEASGAPIEEHVRLAITDPDAWVMPQFSGGVMPGNYEEQLTEEQIADLVAFVVDSVQ